MAIELRCENIRAGYGRSDILRAATCRFGAGRLSAILGPNGAGKTTLLRAICGALPLRGGTLLLDGADLARLKPRERAKRIALAPQLAAETIPLTVREAVAIARYPHERGWSGRNGTEHPAVLAAIQALGLERYADTQCAMLSGGEWRRALIAQGLAQAADVLLLDEPTAFLDPPARISIMAQLRELAHANGLIVVVVLHDPELAARFADDAVLLRDGAVLRAGAVVDVVTEAGLAELYANPLEMNCKVVLTR
jgi:iron complex transport system ATP-binding protein